MLVIFFIHDNVQIIKLICFFLKKYILLTMPNKAETVDHGS